MKRFHVLMAVCAVVVTLVFMGSCSKSDSSVEAVTSKNITYAASLNSNEGFVVKGSYVNDKGETVRIEEALPFKKEFKNVSSSVKASFEGYLFNVATKEIAGVISMTVVAANSGKSIYQNNKNLNLRQDRYFTGDELKEKTAFNFGE